MMPRSEILPNVKRKKSDSDLNFQKKKKKISHEFKNSGIKNVDNLNMVGKKIYFVNSSQKKSPISLKNRWGKFEFEGLQKHKFHPKIIQKA